jgi:hypothetical protein
LLGDGLDGGHGGPVAVGPELGVFDEAILVYELLEDVFGDESVVFAVFFAGARGACCV